MAVMLLFVLLFTRLSSGENVIYELTDQEYARMPPLFHLDLYDHCLQEHGGVYCTVSFDLVTDQPNSLYTMIQDYSASTATHFNHSQLQYGLCLTKTCKKFYQGGPISDQKTILEACLNSSLWNDYTLKARVSSVTCEQKSRRNFEFDIYDAIVAVVLTTFLALNLFGSLHEMFYAENTTSDVQGSIWSNFSVARNWRKLTSPWAAGPEPRLTRLKGFNGLKALTTAVVIMGHSLLPFVVDVDNPQFLEVAHHSKFLSVILHGTLCVQIFFILSSFLLSFNTLLMEEKHLLNWDMLPWCIFNRWLRLTPPYFVMLALTATWLRYAGTGPLWESFVGFDAKECRRDWWLHLLFINNYIDYSNCMTQTWYLAADFQLYIIGLIVLLSVAKLRKRILTLLFFAGVTMTTAHTYFQDLDINIVMSPEGSRKNFMTDRTFHHTYKRGHTNLSSYVIGLSLGMLVYRWQKTSYKFNKFVRHPLLQWLVLPAMVAVIMLSGSFFRDGPRPSVYLRAAFAGIAKPLFSCCVAFLVLGMVFQFEKSQRGFLEANIWTLPSRVSYCGYLVHGAIIRYLTGTRTTLVHVSFMLMMEVMISSLILAYLVAIPLHLLVEAPVGNLIKYTFSTPQKTQKKVSSD